MLKILAFFSLFLISVNFSFANADSSKVKKNRAKLISKKACKKCDLEAVNLDGEKLEGAKLNKADLSGASLVGADLSGANFEGADLRGADFEGAELDNANLRNARLEGADLEGANLDGARLDGALLTGAKMILGDFHKFKFKGRLSFDPDNDICFLPCEELKLPASIQQQSCFRCLGLAGKENDCRKFCQGLLKTDTKNPLFQKCIDCSTDCLNKGSLNMDDGKCYKGGNPCN